MSTNQQKLNSKKILEEAEEASGDQLESVGDVINFEVSIKIKDSKETLSIAGEVTGPKNERSCDVKINQKKTISLEMMVVEKDYI